jgi:hypothetical protein
MTRLFHHLFGLAGPIERKVDSKRWIVPGSRLLATERAATRQNGSPPARGVFRTPDLLDSGFWLLTHLLELLKSSKFIFETSEGLLGLVVWSNVCESDCEFARQRRVE